MSRSRCSLHRLALPMLGADSDTTGAVAGGLAGVYYGYCAIPQQWLQKLARFDDILALGKRFVSMCLKKFNE